MSGIKSNTKDLGKAAEKLFATIKKPLYMVLNEQRTQGEWYQFADTIQVELGKVMDVCTENKTCKDKWNANAQYTALAVNNLHILAEELENVLWNFEGKEGLTDVQKACVKCCKEALNRIS